VIIPPAGYFQKIQAVLDRYDIILWDDEVICGFGRLGEDIGATKLGMKPKMMSLAKGLSSAYMPISAAQVDELVDKLGRALDATLQHVADKQLLVA
jgi:adenosylmethionine-8-amino-7-oxononanoate aminotransferase